MRGMIQSQNARIQALEEQLKQKDGRIEGLIRQLRDLQRQLAEARKKRSEPGKGGRT
ncbi:Putative Methyltransferase family protein [Thermobacillus xylanilyticus]|nr:hypothetical protein [Thermobacillus xylanilyticus]CAG5078369.1 Putative Methyltransferase family protein [Thermobacillus xylanilyticus]